MAKKSEINIPGADGRLQSVGIIMDGNGRWAKARGLSRNEGHKAGAKVIEEVIRTLKDLGVHHVTLYAFSTENWRRPKEEVDGIMNLIYGYLDRIKEIGKEYETSVRFIGDKSPLPEKLRRKCIEIENMSSSKSNIVNVALNYGGRDEIIRAARLIAEKAAAGELSASDVSAELISDNLYTANMPDPDVIIRPSGEKRLSNFLLWQCAYSEFVFMDVLWPDFTPAHLDEAIAEFSSRSRRFGGI